MSCSSVCVFLCGHPVLGHTQVGRCGLRMSLFGKLKNLGENLGSHVHRAKVSLQGADSLSIGQQSYSLEEQIAEGGFGFVWRGVDDKGMSVAVKKMNIRSSKQLKAAKNEIAIMVFPSLPRLSSLHVFASDRDSPF